jgi:hypothetical protein
MADSHRRCLCGTRETGLGEKLIKLNSDRVQPNWRNAFRSRAKLNSDRLQPNWRNAFRSRAKNNDDLCVGKSVRVSGVPLKSARSTFEKAAPIAEGGLLQQVMSGNWFANGLQNGLQNTSGPGRATGG